MQLSESRALDLGAVFFEKLSHRNPLLADHLNSWRNRSLGEYASYIWNGFAPSKKYQLSSGFINAVDRISHNRFGSHIDVKAQLTHCPVVLSAHHTAPLFHPIAIQTLLAAVAGNRAPEVIPVLCTDWIPMDNLFYPRGLLIPGKDHTHCVNLFGKSSRKRVVSGMEAFTFEDYENLLRSVDKLSCSDDINTERLMRAVEVVSRFYGDDAVLAQKSYSAQCALMNYKMCKELMPEKEFVFINISELATQLLIEQLHQPDSVIYQLLFNPAVRDTYLRQLDGVSGCWNLARQQGSVFFWSVEGQRMLPFTIYNQGTLVGDDVSLSLAPEAVIAALEEGHIIPGMALVFSLLMFAEGAACVGGMRQIVYNTAIREACAQALKPVMPERYESIADHPVEMISAGLFPLVNEKGLPRHIVELMAGNALEPARLGEKRLIDVVLDAQAELLALS